MANPSFIVNNGYNGTPQSIIPIYPTTNEDGLDIDALTQINKQLTTELKCERELRERLEQENSRLKGENLKLFSLLDKRKRRKKSEMVAKETEYSELKSDGKRKPQVTEPIRSYTDFVNMQEYLLNNGTNGLRDWMMWTVGVSLGLRISDIFNIKYRYLLNQDKTFKDRMVVLEKKTSKLNNILITESVKFAVSKYLDSINWKFKLDDYIFTSSKTGNRLTERHGWKILSNAGKALELPINIGSHTMRKSFANIAACADKSSIDMNTITKVQGLLNHSDQKVTLKYLGSFQKMYDNARAVVSDFVLGKTDITDITPGSTCTLDEIMSKLDMLENKLDAKEE